jgi:BirA family biotin operon repressor/biotin-[acetyl-CoA-carboxylase] ligase
LFSQTSAVHSPKTPFIIVSEVDSTNNYAMAKLHKRLLPSETAILAMHQSAGKGQRGRHWQTTPGENITMSTVFDASAMTSVSRFPFLLSATAALACYDFFKDLKVQDVTIKWPNDVYVGDRKAGGILLENILKGSSIDWSIIGTGINLNQDHFEGLSKATSIRLATGKTYDVVEMGRNLRDRLSFRFAALKVASVDQVMAEYNANLYKANAELRLKKNNIVFNARILHVSNDGELVTMNQLEQRFKVGEVEFV